ncbi:MAG: septum formation initiator family protein [Spirochaetales bacterium]|nr:septum formation initiator family protein [Spirochaetales bacterium]
MLGKCLVPALFVGLYVYLSLNLFWGDQGIYALRTLQDERKILEDNMEILTRENRDVQIHLDQLKNDRYSISLLARKLGYIREGEKIIYTGLGFRSGSISYGLPVIRTGKSLENRDRTGFFRIIALTAGGSAFFLLLIWSWGEKGIRRRI